MIPDSRANGWVEGGGGVTLGRYQREVYSLFGLPVDNLSLAETKIFIRQQVRFKKNLVLSTININWVARSLADHNFRSAILDSDLVTLDGRPLLWLSAFFGYPMRETVPGSTLVQDILEEDTSTPLTIFLFGGDDRAAEIAKERINQRQGGLRAVGAINPGYGSVDEMSGDKVIEEINKVSPDILLVALGARKGVQWIEKNRDRLNAGVISHLGATVNFLAGTVQRSPRFMQQCGMEWVWRIIQEPKLFSRYAADGLVIFWWLARNIRGIWDVFFLARTYRFATNNVQIIQTDQSDEIWISFGGAISLIADSRTRELFGNIALSGKNVVCDFRKVQFVNGAFASALIWLQHDLEKLGRKLEFMFLNQRLHRLFELYGCPVLLRQDRSSL